MSELDYIPDAWAGIELLCIRDYRVREAVRKLRDGDITGGIIELMEAGLDDDQIELVTATVLQEPLSRAEEHVREAKMKIYGV